MKEIGSEFWKPSTQHIKDNETLYLCGRTALDVIVKDAVRTYGISSALLPSYCCHTMIEPFLQNGVDIRFYDVFADEEGILTADVPAPQNNEMLYIMKYFGDIDIKYEGAGRNLNEWLTSVEDLTHSCFMEGYSMHTDYWFTSYRKWFAVEGIAVAGKRGGRLLEASKNRNEAYYDLRRKAFSLKNRFMNGDPIEKSEFLSVFGKAESLLSRDYIDYGTGYEESYTLFRFLDEIKHIKQRRRDNARILIEGLTDIIGIKVITDFKDDKKCPLFVPVVVKDGKRDALRSCLTSKDIYCPVHWPLSKQHVGISERAKEIYAEELSLVCDQRYGDEDMERTVQEIQKFMIC